MLTVDTELERLHIYDYFLRITDEYEMRARRMGWWLHHLKTLRTTFNIILPAILALQNLGQLTTVIMWLTWGLSLSVTLATGYIDLYRLDDLYEQFTRASELLKLEGWRYFGLTGRYSGFRDHQSALPVFLGKVARIRRRMIDEEFPASSSGAGVNSNSGPSSIISGSPGVVVPIVRPSPIIRAVGASAATVHETVLHTEPHAAALPRPTKRIARRVMKEASAMNVNKLASSKQAPNSVSVRPPPTVELYEAGSVHMSAPMPPLKTAQLSSSSNTVSDEVRVYVPSPAAVSQEVDIVDTKPDDAASVIQEEEDDDVAQTRPDGRSSSDTEYLRSVNYAIEAATSEDED